MRIRLAAKTISLVFLHRWFALCIFSALSLISCRACDVQGQAVFSGSAIAQAAEHIRAYGPKFIVSNEAHSDGVTRFISACFYSELTELLHVPMLAAETLRAAESIELHPYDHTRIQGYYISSPHFDDLFHLAGQSAATLQGYDRVGPATVDRRSLAEAGYHPSRWNIRDRSSAMILLAALDRQELDGAVFVHVGPGHADREFHTRNGGLTTGLAGHLQDLSGARVVSIDNALSELSDFWTDKFFPCPSHVDFEVVSIVVQVRANVVHCIRKSDFKPHRPIHDINVVDRPAARSNGFVAPEGWICNHRTVFSGPIPEALADSAALRVTVMQRDGVGRYVQGWREHVERPLPAQVSLYPLATDEMTVIWEALDEDGQVANRITDEVTSSRP